MYLSEGAKLPQTPPPFTSAIQISSSDWASSISKTVPHMPFRPSNAKTTATVRSSVAGAPSSTLKTIVTAAVEVLQCRDWFPRRALSRNCSMRTPTTAASRSTLPATRTAFSRRSKLNCWSTNSRSSAIEYIYMCSLPYNYISSISEKIPFTSTS